MAEDNFEQRSAVFIDWLQQHPGVSISPKIELADLRSRAAGRGVIAREDIIEQEELFSIPYAALLSAHNSDLQNHIADDLAALDPWLRLVLVMVYESGKGKASRWWPYWGVLPSELNTLVYWSDSELAELQGCTVLHKIGKAEADQTFVEQLLPLAIRNASLFGEYASFLTNPDPKSFFLSIAHRMATLVMAYAFDVEKEEQVEDADEDGFVSEDEENPEKAMVPLADMLNANGEQNNAKLYHGDTCLTMIAIKKIEAGQEILNDYGSLPRSDLLRRYGYLTEEYKKWDVVEINRHKLGEFEDTGDNLLTNAWNKVATVAQRWDVWEGGYDLSRQAGDPSLLNGGFDPGLLAVLKLATCSKTEFKAMERMRTAPPATIPNGLGMKLLYRMLKARQRDYPTSLAQDTNILQSGTLPTRLRQAVEIRRGEKEIIARVLDYCDQAGAANDLSPPKEPNGHTAKRRKT